MKIDWGRLQTILVCLVLLLVLLAALGWLLSQISYALMLFLLAAVLALVLVPLVDWGEDHRLPRWLAVLLTYLIVAAIFAGSIFLLIAPLASQAVQLSHDIPGYATTINDELLVLEANLRGTPLFAALEAVQTRLLTTLATVSGYLVSGVIGALAGFGGTVVDAFIMLIISIYMLAGGKRIHAAVHDAIPPPYRSHFLFTTDTLSSVVGSYIRIQLVLALLLGVLVAVGMSLLGVPYALLLAMLATGLGLVPMFGSVLSAVPALLVALTQPFPTVLWVLIFFIAVQNVQDQILAPRLHAGSMGMHPLAVMFALLAGVQIGGGLGAIFALPVAGFAWIVLVAVYRSLRTAMQPLVVSPAGPSSATGPVAPSPLAAADQHDL
jgi:predicted PurR-regulated permease PerM